MTAEYRLRGYADTVGKGIGFFVPVFDRTSNALFVQRVADDGTIFGFEEIENVDARITYVDPVPVQRESEAIWAFSFGPNDIVSGRFGEFREALAARIDDPVFEERPFLGIEVAEFLNLRGPRSVFIRTALQRMHKKSEAANSWFDLSILTPDLRTELRREFPYLGAQIDKVVATTSGKELVIRGWQKKFDGGGYELEGLTSKVMDSLRDVYPAFRSKMTVRLILDRGSRQKPDTDIIVLVADPQQWEMTNYIQDQFERRIDAFRSEDLEVFGKKALDPSVKAFVVLRASVPNGPLWQNAFSGTKVTRIEFGSLRQLQARGIDLLTSRHDDPHVYVTSTGLPRTRQSPKVMAATVRQIIAAVTSIERNRGSQIESGGWAFFRATGSGAQPTIDCWAVLYDRVWQAGVETAHSYRLDGTYRKNRDEGISDQYAEALFPSAMPLRDKWLDAELKSSRIDGAILCYGELRYEFDIEAHSRAMESILRLRGWEPKFAGADNGTVFHIQPAGSLRRASSMAAELPVKMDWDLRRASAALPATETIALSREANAAAILSYLHLHGELIVSMRDLCASSPEDGIWGILAAQMKRFSGGPLNRARTHFMALLVQQAFEHGNVRTSDEAIIRDAIYGPSLGDDLHFTWTKVRRIRHGMQAVVRLMAGGENRYFDHGTDLVEPFVLVVHDQGVAIIGDEDRGPSPGHLDMFP